MNYWNVYSFYPDGEIRNFFSKRVFYQFTLIIILAYTIPAFSSDDGTTEKRNSSNQNNIKTNDKQGNENYEEYLAAEGKIIRNISIRLIDVSGPEVEETSGGDTSWLGKIANSLHYKTREWVVRNTLLFNSGDTVNAIKLYESERLLRSSGFFRDARVKINSRFSSGDSVDIDVITKDKWTLSFLLSYDPKNKNSYAGVRDYNLLGLGHVLDLVLTHDENSSTGWGGSFKYNAINVGGSFVNAGINLESNQRYTKRNINLSRPIVSTEIEWGGGLNLTWEQGKYEYISSTDSFYSIPYYSYTEDIWTGKSFPAWFGSKPFRQISKFVLSGRITSQDFTKRPFVNENNNRLFENYTLYLFSLGIISSRFYKDLFVEGFGTTEDIPVGGLISMTGGYEDREFNKRWYYAIESVYSDRIWGIGYISGKFGLGGFRNINKWEQNVFNLNFLYHSPLVNRNKWKFRLVVNNDYLYGFNRFEGEQIYLDPENGLRGFNNHFLFGKKRIVLNSELLVFSPYSPLGFVPGGILFADLGIISGTDDRILNSRLYQGYGLGLRIGNESFVRSTFQISLVYNPYTPGSTPKSNDIKIIFTGNIVLGTRQFSLDQPSILNFNEIR